MTGPNTRDGKAPEPKQRFRLIAWMAGVLVALLIAIIAAASIQDPGTSKALLDKIPDIPGLGDAGDRLFGTA